jgi:hypothetical protein
MDFASLWSDGGVAPPTYSGIGPVKCGSPEFDRIAPTVINFSGTPARNALNFTEIERSITVHGDRRSTVWTVECLLAVDMVVCNDLLMAHSHELAR